MALPRFQRGGDLNKELTADKLNAIVDAVRECQLIPSSSLLIGKHPSGTSVEVRRQQGASQSDSYQQFQLVVMVDPADIVGGDKIRVIPSTLAGGSSVDLGFSTGDRPGYYLDPSEGVLQGGITISATTGEITSRWLEIVGTLSEDTDTSFFIEIGTVHYNTVAEAWECSNSRFGPINATVCRNWYASEAPYFGVSFS